MEQLYIIMVDGMYLVGKNDLEKHYWISKSEDEKRKRISSCYTFSEDKHRALCTNRPEAYVKGLEANKFVNIKVIPREEV